MLLPFANVNYDWSYIKPHPLEIETTAQQDQELGEKEKNEKSSHTSETTARASSKPSESAIERVWGVRLCYERKEPKALIRLEALSPLRSPTKVKSAILQELINIFQCSFGGCFHILDIWIPCVFNGI